MSFQRAELEVKAKRRQEHLQELEGKVQEAQRAVREAFTELNGTGAELLKLEELRRLLVAEAPQPPESQKWKPQSLGQVLGSSTEQSVKQLGSILQGFGTSEAMAKNLRSALAEARGVEEAAARG
eukprot:9298286-Pyramimonas_sp.AAC.1